MPRRALASLPMLVVLLAALAAGPARADWRASGRCLFPDRPFDRDGFTGETVLKPVRCAIVQVVDSALTKNNVLASGMTGEDGSFSVPVRDSLVRTVYVRVLAASADSGRYRMRVEGLDSHDHMAILALSGPMAARHDPGADLRVLDGRPMLAAAADAGRAFHALDVLEQGVDYVAELTGGKRPRRTLHLTLQGTGGAYYSNPGWNPEVVLDPDRAYDDCLVLHEEGHYMEDEFSQLGRGGGHSLSDSDQDITLSWAEGWATFYCASVRRNLGVPDSEFYVDLLDGASGRGFGFAYNLESPPWTLTGAASEAVVQSILWDITDGSDGRGGVLKRDDDPMALPDGSVWDVFSRYLDDHAAPATLERFWDGWFARGWARDAQIREIFGHFGVEMHADSLENDDWAARARELGPDEGPAHHSLFPAGDRDWVRFQAVAGQGYLIETTGLVGRCATRLSLFGPDTSALITTAGAFNRVDFSSAIQFRPASSGIYYVRCDHDPNPWTGEYGSYDLRVSTVGPVPEYRILRAFDPGQFVPLGMTAAGDDEFYVWGRASGKLGGRGQVLLADAAGGMRLLHEFTLAEGFPVTLAALPGGSVAGIASWGQRDGQGASSHLFRLGRDGRYTVLMGFAGPVGTSPRKTLAVGKGGEVYGSTSQEGLFGDGCLFRCDTTGDVKLVRSFGNDNQELLAGPVLDADGSVCALMYEYPRTVRDTEVVWLGRADSDTSLARHYTFPVRWTRRCLAVALPDGGIEAFLASSDSEDVFRVEPDGSGSRVYAAASGPFSEILRNGGVIAGSDGRAYAYDPGLGYGGGGLYRLDPSGALAGLRTFHVRDTFPDLDGRWPVALAEGRGGSLVGLTLEGGSLGGGVMFRLEGAMGRSLASVPAPVARATHSYVQVDWTARLDGILAFQLERATAPAGPYSAVVRMNGGGNVFKTYRDEDVRPGTQYFYRVAYRMVPSEPWSCSALARVTTPAAVFALHMPTPNPGQGDVRIRYEMARRGDARIEVFDVAGRVVRTLWQGPLEAGAGTLTWNGTNARGEAVGSGVFFLRLAAGDESRVRKLVRIH